eukprot:Opistho-2@26553
MPSVPWLCCRVRRKNRTVALLIALCAIGIWAFSWTQETHSRGRLKGSINAVLRRPPGRAHGNGMTNVHGIMRDERQPLPQKDVGGGHGLGVGPNGGENEAAEDAEHGQGDVAEPAAGDAAGVRPVRVVHDIPTGPQDRPALREGEFAGLIGERVAVEGALVPAVASSRIAFRRLPCEGGPLQSAGAVVDVVAVCTGVTASRMAVTMIKSVLYRRTVPLRFHIVTDDEFASSLVALLREWELPEVEVVIYDAAECFRRVEWVPNVHYSGRNGLLKLALHEVLPPSVTRAVVLDTDVLILVDIRMLIETLAAPGDGGGSAPCIAMAENLSDWYLGRLPVVRFPWPAVGRGLNTGVSAVDLACLRHIGWTEMWEDEADRQIASRRRKWPDEPRLYAAQLADQDIVNSMLASDVRGGAGGSTRLRDVVRQLPCEWNLQIGDNADPWRCIKRGTNETVADALRRAHVVHWNSRKKMRAEGDVVAQMRARYSFYANLTPDVLGERSDRFVCGRTEAV